VPCDCISCYFYGRFKMSLSKHIRKEIQEFFINRMPADERTVISAVDNLKKASSLAMFFCINSRKELDVIRHLSGKALKDYKSLRIFVFTNSHESLDVITNKSISFFNLDDFTLFGKMKEQLSELIEKNKFDLLISFDKSGFPVCQRIISEIKAGFKIGADNTKTTHLYHLTLACKEDEFNMDRFYEQVRHYISILNIKTIS